MSLYLFFIGVALKSFVLMLMVATAVACCQRASAALRHCIWTLGLCGTLAIPFVSLIGPDWKLELLPAAVPTASATATSSVDAMSTISVDESPPTSLSQTGDAVSPKPQVASEAVDAVSLDRQPVSTGPLLVPIASDRANIVPSVGVTSVDAPMHSREASDLPRTRWVLSIWLLGMVALIANWTIRSVNARRWLRRATPIRDRRILGALQKLEANHASTSQRQSARVRLMQSEEVTMPCATGIFHRTILLPANASTWREDQLRGVLLHEFAHIIRRDVLTQSLAELVRAIYWFNPLVWIATSRLRLEREQACDDHVVRAGFRTSDYAQLLLQIARTYRDEHQRVGLAMACPHELQRRIGSLLDSARTRTPVPRRRAISILLATIVITGITAAVRPVSSADEPIGLVASDVTATANGSWDSVDSWIRGSDLGLQIRIHGELRTASGEAFVNPIVKLRITSDIGESVVQPSLRENRFEYWLPMSDQRWYSLMIEASDRESNQTAVVSIMRSKLREAAINGIDLVLDKPTNSATVQVREGDKPIENATVKTVFSNGRVAVGQTNPEGLATIQRFHDETLRSLTAWTADHKIGGYQFSRQPVRSAEAPTHTIDLHACRDLTVRAVDTEGSPVAGARFNLQVATPPPNYNYLGIVDDSNLITDANGEAVFRWFPDWPDVHSYAEIQDDRWYIKGDPQWIDGTMVLTLAPSTKRKRVEGQVDGDLRSVAGLNVRFDSFQAERENYSDRISVSCDPSGRFWADVLPDATYAVYVLEPNLVSDYADVIAYDSKTGTVTSPRLKLQQGVLARVRLTAGSNRQPIANQAVTFADSHSFEWTEDGETQTGSSGRAISARTDDQGMAEAIVLPEKLQASVYMSNWNANGTIDAQPDQENLLELHREIAEARKVTGRLIGNDKREDDLAGTELIIGSLDAETRDNKELLANDVGKFAFETSAVKIGICALSADGTEAGVIVTDELVSPLVVKMIPTETYTARLVDPYGAEVAGRKITAHVRIKDTKQRKTTNAFGIIQFPPSVDVAKFSTVTAEDGTYTFTQLPCFTEVRFYAEDESWPLASVYLEPSESRPMVVHQLQGDSDEVGHPQQSSEQQWSKRLRDCRLNDYRLIAIVASRSDAASKFVKENFEDYRRNRDVASFMSIKSDLIPNLDDADRAFAAKMNWPEIAGSEVFACVYDTDGNELSRRKFSIANDSGEDQVAAFLAANSPEKKDPVQAWNDAFALAKKSERRVWARIGGRYCGPCFTFSRWLDDHSELLQKDFVMLKLGETATSDHPELIERLTGGGHFGIPFHAIFDADETMMIDSNGPLGNIGSPSDFEGKKQIRKMLGTGRVRLTSAEIDQIVETIAD